MKAGKLYRWYKESLSGFTEQSQQQILHLYDTVDTHLIEKETGQPKQVAVPILKEENMGEEMAIDEKMINGEYYTVLSNSRTGKIALLAATQRTSILTSLIQHFGDKNFVVKWFTRDLSNTYDWVGRQVFMNAAHVADKFHVLQHLFDSLQDMRRYYRHQLLTQRRQQYEAFKQQQKESATIKKATFKYNEPKLANGETLRELLARSQYLLYKHPDQWSTSQQQRAQILFKQYPDIAKAYHLCIKFRQWFSKDNIGKKLSYLTKQLDQWYKTVNDAAIEEMLNFKSLVERHQGVILNYFVEGKTNAIAESINAKIQNFIHANLGTRDIDFFHFRVKNYFS